MWQITCLYFWKGYGNLCCCCRADRRIQRLYERGLDRIEREFDIVKIVSSLRNLKVFTKGRFMDKKVSFEVKHSEANVIEIDHSFNSESSHHSDS